MVRTARVETVMTLLTDRRGFTLIEILMVIALISILSVVSTEVLTDSLTESRFEATTAKMNQIKNAILGDSLIKEVTTRTSFGFTGDIGAIPTAGQGIAALIAKPAALPTYSVNTAARIGLGWNGPYLTAANSGSNFTVDGWGNAFVYSPGASPPTLVSLGADGVVGGTGLNQDITVNLPIQESLATVSGFICQSAGPFASNADVQLNYPNGAGALTPLATSLKSLTSTDQGSFSFASVPFGVRSITIYRPNIGTATPATTLGPILITVDRPNFVVPCDRIDIAP